MSGSNEAMLPAGQVDVCTVSNVDNSTTGVAPRKMERFESSDGEVERHYPVGFEEITVMNHCV